MAPPSRAGLGVPAPLHLGRCTHHGSHLPRALQPLRPPSQLALTLGHVHPAPLLIPVPAARVGGLGILGLPQRKLRARRDPGGFVHGDRSGSEHPGAVPN